MIHGAPIIVYWSMSLVSVGSGEEAPLFCDRKRRDETEENRGLVCVRAERVLLFEEFCWL